MKKDIVEFVSKYPNWKQVKAKHQRPYGVAQNINISECKCEMINMDFIIGLPRPRRQHDPIWVISGQNHQISSLLAGQEN